MRITKIIACVLLLCSVFSTFGATASARTLGRPVAASAPASAQAVAGQATKMSSRQTTNPAAAKTGGSGTGKKLTASPPAVPAHFAPAVETASDASVAPFTANPPMFYLGGPARHLYGLVGQGGLGEPISAAMLAQQYNSGVRGRLLELGWDVLQPNGPADWNSGAAGQFQARIDAFAASGPDTRIYLDLGMQYPPAWAANTDPLVDQYGRAWQAHGNGGGVNVYWSATVRGYVAGYIQHIFTGLNFHGRLWAVRIGPYVGELSYPRQEQPGLNHSFWAFDPAAQAQSPVPGWRPGQPSPHGEARAFYYWYVDNLANTFTFMLQQIRRYYAGYVAPATPGQGIWDGTANLLVSRNLNDPAELCCYGTGNYWQRIYARLPPASAGVINWCSSVGDGSGQDDSPNWWQWSSAKQLAYLARLYGRAIYGESTGQNAYDASQGADPRTTMVWMTQLAQSSGYLGLMWVRQTDMSNPAYASLSQYARQIGMHP